MSNTSHQAPKATAEQVILVDASDQPCGTEEKLKAHHEGLLHRAFSVFVLREVKGKTETLLQRRQKDKYHSPGLWTNTCCSHPRPGEDTLDAAQRRLQEEMGFTVPVKEIGVFQYRAEFGNGLIEHEIDHVCVGGIGNHDPETLTTCFNPDEVDACRWQALDDLQSEIEQHPERFTPWLHSALQLVIGFLDKPNTV